MPTDSTRAGIRVRELRLAGSLVRDRSYGVNFTNDSGQVRPLSVIAGPSQTGKTSVAEFILYCLGDSHVPSHPEILTSVRAALLEAAFDNEETSIERGATGRPSSFASVWQAPFSRIDDATELRLPVEPTGDPSGLSQFVLSACGLDNVELPVAPKSGESGTQTLSIRDVFRLMWLPNERLDNKNLLFEQSPYMIRQKFEQLIDVVFDVHDAEGAREASRLRAATAAVREAQAHARSLRDVVQQEYPQGPLALDLTLAEYNDQSSRLEQELQALDTDSGASPESNLRELLRDAEDAARSARLRVRNRKSLLDRLTALKAQYADDIRKLTFLREAERVFDPLLLTTCPACFNPLKEAPRIHDGNCSLCGGPVEDLDVVVTLGEAISAEVHTSSSRDISDPRRDAADTGSQPSMGRRSVIEAELKAAAGRFEELAAYWDRLNADLVVLERAADDAQDRALHAAKALDQVADLPAPYLALRDDLTQRIASARVEVQQASAGIRLWNRVSAADEMSERLAGKASQIRAAKKAARFRPDRQEIVSQLSDRFELILRAIGYPKLSSASLDSRLVPTVRGLPYTSASSGGLTLISLAWYLAVWEVAYEREANAPGLLIVDSPQKNLGHSADPTDPDFADAALVENFYRHVKEWLSGAGRGAQCIVIDNTPPPLVVDDIVMRFTRDRRAAPYGLIEDAID